MIATINMIRGEEQELDILYEDCSAYLIGNRIKKIRETREMTRAELGSLIGLDQNRVQHYENGRRKPKISLLKQIAEALGVETIALMEPNIETYVGIMHAFFQMETWFDIDIVEKDGCYYLQFGDGKTGRMNDYLRKWHDVRENLHEAIPNLTNEELKKKVFDYNMFEWTFPKGMKIDAFRRYDQHPINRMQEIREDNEIGKQLKEEAATRRN